jgi:hypothetical protein
MLPSPISGEGAAPMSPVIALWLGHEQLATAQLYLNSQELHQTGAFSLVA